MVYVSEVVGILCEKISFSFVPWYNLYEGLFRLVGEKCLQLKFRDPHRENLKLEDIPFSIEPFRRLLNKIQRPTVETF